MLRKKYITGEEFTYVGKTLTLHIGNYSTIQVKGEHLLYPQVLQFRIQKELTTWYIKEGKRVITERLEWYANAMKLSYGMVTFSDTKSRWGACSPSNDLQFNWRLIMAPLLTINYVVVHELVHTVEKNHSRDFYSRVRYYSPTYRIQQEWLKKNGHTLII